MFTARNSSAVLYSNLIGQRQVRVTKSDQTEAPPGHGQNWSLGPNLDHFAQCEWSLPNKRRNTSKCNQKANVWIDLIKNVAMYLYKHINMGLCDIKLFSADYY